VEVSHYLSALEAAFGHAPGAIRLLVIATETPRGALSLAQYSEVLKGATLARLAGLTWGMEDLGAALGVRAREVDGVLTFPFQLARAQCLLTAASLEVLAIDGVYTRHTDSEGLRHELEGARRDGFLGKLAIHPAQVEPINAAFTPEPTEVAHAQAVLAAFAESGGSGVVSLNGRMLDRPHLLAAQRLLAAAAAAT
jgi:citrate lyase subunit beta/citryl-CoA lyase